MDLLLASSVVVSEVVAKITSTDKIVKPLNCNKKRKQKSEKKKAVKKKKNKKVSIKAKGEKNLAPLDESITEESIKVGDKIDLYCKFKDCYNRATVVSKIVKDNKQKTKKITQIEGKYDNWSSDNNVTVTLPSKRVQLYGSQAHTKNYNPVSY